MTRDPVDRADDTDLIDGGYLYLARAFFESRIWVGLKSSHIIVALACLFLAVWKDTTVKIDDVGEVHLKRGQFWLTQNRLAKRCPKDVTRRVIRRALQNLRRLDFLRLKTVHAAGQGAVPAYTLGTICNYRRYQDPSLYTGQGAGHAAGQHKKEVHKNASSVKAMSSDFIPWAKELIEDWNRTIARSPATIKISAVIWDDHGELPLGLTRMKHLAARFQEPMFVLNRDRIFAGILKSALLSGRLIGKRTGKYRNFRASFTWLIQNTDNYRFVLEGQYEDGPAQGDKPSGLRPKPGKYSGLGVRKKGELNDKLF